jgi:secondary thiamine-phosphate synthase enzyme
MPADGSAKASITTTRTNPVIEGQTGVPGLIIHGETLIVPTSERVELIDLTDRISSVIASLAIREGLVSLWSLHTTCALLINESQAALLADIKRFLEGIVERDKDWMHNDPTHSDCDRMNADAHLRALLLGHSLSMQVSNGEVVLGQWQRILVAELDGPRDRSIRVQVWGIG